MQEHWITILYHTIENMLAKTINGTYACMVHERKVDYCQVYSSYPDWLYFLDGMVYIVIQLTLNQQSIDTPLTPGLKLH